MFDFIAVALFMMTFHSNGNDKTETLLSTFNVVKTAQFCSLHFHERICVREKPHECV